MVSPTPYPEVNTVVDELHNTAKEILDDQFVGMYLFGSLTTGTFDRASDVDILFVTKDGIQSELFEALKSMHARIAEMDVWCATQLEVSYIPQKALRRFDPNDKLFPRLDRGWGESLYWMPHDSDWVVQRHLVREKGIIIEAPSPTTLIDPVSPDDLREAMRPVLWDWLAHLPEHSEQIKHRGYQSYIVLTVCRVLFTLQNGEVASKPEAADWAKSTLDKRWRPLIERAWVGRQNAGMKADPEELKETMEFIQYACQLQK
jgi:predicted nucleotidyltransferase